MQENINNTQILEEDEIDLRELFATIWNAKKFIAIFSFVVVFLTLIYALSKPNVYTVSSILVPTDAKQSSGGGLGGLAALAGVSIGGGEVTPDIAYNTLLNDQGTMRELIKESNLTDLILEDHSNNYYFALGYRGIFDMFHSSSDEENSRSEDEKIFNAYKALKGMISVSSDKKTGMITLSVSDADMHFAKKVLLLFLDKASKILIQKDLDNINEKLAYYEKVSTKEHDLVVKQQLSSQMTALIQSKVTLLSSPYYKVKKLTEPVLPYYKDKTKPKRGLIMVVSFVTSIILAIFIVFFMEFIKNSRKEELV